MRPSTILCGSALCTLRSGETYPNTLTVSEPLAHGRPVAARVDAPAAAVLHATTGARRRRHSMAAGVRRGPSEPVEGRPPRRTPSENAGAFRTILAQFALAGAGRCVSGREMPP